MLKFFSIDKGSNGLKNISKYLKNLDFEYAISYSGLRGEKFEELEFENKKRIQEIEKESESARFMMKRKLNKKIAELEDEINIYDTKIIDNEGKLHKSAELIYRFEKNDPNLDRIFEVLKSKFKSQAFAMCSPIFRDAIVFYSKDDEISGMLHICFGCDLIQNENSEIFEVDNRIFPLFKVELRKLGHKIEDN